MHKALSVQVKGLGGEGIEGGELGLDLTALPHTSTSLSILNWSPNVYLFYLSRQNAKTF